MWNFKSVPCTKDCDLKSCKDLNDYIQNVDKCRGTAGVYRLVTKLLSFIPFTGASNFYSGNKFSAVFELIEGIVVLILLFTCCSCCCCCFNNTVTNDEKQSLLAIASMWSFLLTAINIVRFVICEALADSFELNYELALMMMTLVLSIISCCCGWADERGWIVSTIVNIILIELVEMARDVYIAVYNEKDGHGCPFTETWE